ncbi:MAG: LysR family transcriptional regulator [Lachnospiraceae bacterium]|nr:LysR family transcriptional regulator [Lachnospiraceae bacterium]
MELRVLRYYLTVAREENITRAAEILHITQPTLSRQMAELEEELDTRLFERSNRRISLTEAGMLLRRRAEELVTLADKTEQEFKTGGEELTGLISIGSGVTAAVSEALPELLETYSQKHSQVRFELHTGTAAVIKDQLDKGLLDIGILMEPIEVEKYDFLRLPQKDVWGILMPEDDPLAEKSVITPGDLQSLPLIVNWRIVEREAKAWFGGSTEHLNVFCSYDLIDNAALLVERHLGYAFVIEAVAKNRQGLAFRPLSPEISNTSVLVWKKYQPASLAVQKFIELARNAYGA